jgi:hypothetical protein
MEVSGQLHDPAALTSRKEPHLPTEQEAGRAPEPVSLLRRNKSLASAGNRTPFPQPSSP